SGQRRSQFSEAKFFLFANVETLERLLALAECFASISMKPRPLIKSSPAFPNSACPFLGQNAVRLLAIIVLCAPPTTAGHGREIPSSNCSHSTIERALWSSLQEEVDSVESPQEEATARANQSKEIRYTASLECSVRLTAEPPCPAAAGNEFCKKCPSSGECLPVMEAMNRRSSSGRKARVVETVGRSERPSMGQAKDVGMAKMSETAKMSERQMRKMARCRRWGKDVRYGKDVGDVGSGSDGVNGAAPQPWLGRRDSRPFRVTHALDPATAPGWPRKRPSAAASWSSGRGVYRDGQRRVQLPRGPAPRPVAVGDAEQQLRRASLAARPAGAAAVLRGAAPRGWPGRPTHDRPGLQPYGCSARPGWHKAQLQRCRWRRRDPRLSPKVLSSQADPGGISKAVAKQQQQQQECPSSSSDPRTAMPVNSLMRNCRDGLCSEHDSCRAATSATPAPTLDFELDGQKGRISIVPGGRGGTPL
uniref:Reverse transcriptase domain-containing protein n=1 Tax=Macrostomum lignano TaxID=282301 RepID=A0A1I8F7R5_9PLAT